MRISDGSSDVCSSDLWCTRRVGRWLRAPRTRRGQSGAVSWGLLEFLVRLGCRAGGSRWSGIRAPPERDPTASFPQSGEGAARSRAKTDEHEGDEGGSLRDELGDVRADIECLQPDAGGDGKAANRTSKRLNSSR